MTDPRAAHAIISVAEDWFESRIELGRMMDHLTPPDKYTRRDYLFGAVARILSLRNDLARIAKRV